MQMLLVHIMEVVPLTHKPADGLPMLRALAMVAQSFEFVKSPEKRAMSTFQVCAPYAAATIKRQLSIHGFAALISRAVFGLCVTGSALSPDCM